ncbi:hypothetical protein PybrP1_006985 [[Pythium] brassicae (nom. inval.)]|nr:hypothetical protein PybrP1_006985 [[Pythium] brassicae (nom. inval.)]
MASDQQYDVLYKGAVGKTNLLATFLAAVDNTDSSSSSATNADGSAKGFSSVRKPTIGVEFGTKVVQHPNGKRIKAQIWDTAGQERYRAITSSHYRRAAGALVVYDVTNPTSFEHAQQHWLMELKAHADISSTLAKCITLVGNKVDLEPAGGADAAGSKWVPREQHDAAAARLGVMGQRASAKTGQDVRKAFEDLLVAIYDEDKGKFQRIERVATIRLEEEKAGSGGGPGAVGPGGKRDVPKCCTT